MATASGASLALAASATNDLFSDTVAFALETLGLPHVTLKEEQSSAIRSVYEGRDVFVCLPTGFGKSLCYQALPFVMDHQNFVTGKDVAGKSSAVLVISPLIALMEDQVRGLRKKYVKASIITSWKSASKENLATDDSLSSDSIFFCAPEALMMSKWRDAFDKPEFSDRIVAVVMDEAHCISKW